MTRRIPCPERDGVESDLQAFVGLLLFILLVLAPFHVVPVLLALGDAR